MIAAPLEKYYREMTDTELSSAMELWGSRVETAAGWPSAYFAAKQCEQIATEGKSRCLNIENRWMIAKVPS